MVGPGGTLSVDLFQPGLVGDLACQCLVVAIEVGHAGGGRATNQPRQGQALADERDEDDRKSDQQDQVALGKVSRQREGRGKRHSAAQSGPTDDEAHPPGKRPIEHSDLPIGDRGSRLLR